MKKYNSILKQWIKSYWIAFGIPFILIIIVIGIAHQIIYKTIQDVNTQYIKQIGTELQKIDDKIEMISTNIAFNRNFLNIFNTVNYKYINFIQDFDGIIYSLKNYQINHQEIKDIFIYLEKNDIIITADGKYNLNEYKTQRANIEEIIELIGWKEAQKNKDTYYLLDEYNLVYLKSLNFTANKEYGLGYFVGIIPKEDIRQILRDKLVKENNIIMLVDDNNQVILATSYEELLKDSSLLPNKGYIKINNKKYIISKGGLENNKILLLTPNENYFSMINNLYKTFLLGSILAFSLGSIYIVKISRRNYQPIKDIITIINEKMNKKYDHKANVYPTIIEVLENSIEDAKVFKSKFTDELEKDREYFIEALLNGEIHKEYINKKSGQYSNFLGAKYYAILIIRIHEIIEEEANEETYNLFKYALKNVVEEVLGDRDITITDHEKEIIVLISCDELSNCFSQFKVQIKELRDFFYQYFKIKLLIGVSDRGSNINQIAEIYDRASKALEQAYFYENEIVYYEEIKHLFDDNIEKSEVELELNKMVHLIIQGKLEEAEQEWENFIIDIYHQSVYRGKKQLNILANMIEVKFSLIPNIDKSLINIIKDIGENNNLIDLEEKMKYLFHRMSQTNLNASKDNIIYQVKEYIEENYSNPSIGLNEIAESFEVHNTYISKMFKETIGYGVLEYINLLKINKAKELLINKKMNINEISKDIGFSNTNTFIRVFKKYEGVTPGVYKKLYTEKE